MPDQANEQLVIEARLQDLITAEAKRVVQSLRGMGTEVESLGKKAESADVGGSIAKSVPGINLASGALRGLASSALRVLPAIGAAASLYKLTEAADDFERSMRGIVLRVDEGERGMDRLESSILSLSSETGIATEKLASGGAEVLRNFSRSGKDALTILQEVSRTARIAGQDESTTFGQVATVLDGYKLRASDAGDVSEKLFTAALEGKANFGELAAVMGALGPLAKSLGFDFRQTAAVLTAMAPDAGGVLQAGNALHSLFTRLLADKELQQRLQAVGAGFDADAKAGNSLIGVLRGLQDATHGSQSELAGMLGGARGASAALAVTSTDSSKLEAAFSALAMSASEVDQKVRALENLPEEKWDRLKNKVDTFIVELGKVPKAAKDAFLSVIIPDVAPPTLGQNFASSLRNAQEQMRNAVSLGDESTLKQWAEEYDRLAEAAKAAGVAEEAGVLSLTTLSLRVKDTVDDMVNLKKTADGTFDVFIEKAHRAAQVKVSPEAEAKAAELLLAIQARTMTGLQQEAVQHDLIYARIQSEIAAYQEAGANVDKLRSALVSLKAVDADRMNLAEARQRLSLDQQLSAETLHSLQIQQERARAVMDFDRAEELGQQILAERSRTESAASELTIAGLTEQRRIYPQLADAIDKVIAKIRERQYVEGQQARDAMDASNSDAIDKALAAYQARQLAAQKEQLDAAHQVFEAEHQLQVLRAGGLIGLDHELAQIELNRTAAIETAQQEAALDFEKRKRLQSVILLLDAQADRQRLEAQHAQMLRDVEEDRMRLQDAFRQARASGGERLDAIFGAEAIKRFHDDGRDIETTLRELRTSAQGIGLGFQEGMDEALREFSDSANRAMEAGRSLISSFHDEGSRSLSDLLKGNLSGGDALRQFGQGVLGNAIDTGSSQIFDSLTTSIFGAGDRIQQAGVQAAGGVQGAGGVLSGALQGIAGGIGGLLQSLFGGGGPGPGFIGPILQAEGGVWNGALLPIRAAGGGVFGRKTLLEVAEVAGRQEAVVPMHRGGIMADMTTSGPRVRVAGADIPLRFRGGGPGGGVTINSSPTVAVSLTVHSIDPRGAAEVVLAQMPEIQRAITTALVRGSDRALRDAVQGAAR